MNKILLIIFTGILINLSVITSFAYAKLQVTELKSYINQIVVPKLILTYPFITTNDVVITIKNEDILNNLPEKMVTYRITPKQSSISLGLLVLNLDLYDANNQFVGKKALFLNIKAFTNYVYANNPLKIKEKISSADLTYVYNEIYGKPKNAILKIEDAIGKEAYTFISKGSLITKQMLRNVPVIRKGQIVNISYTDNAILLKFTGISLQDGAIGDIIKIRGIKYNKDFKGEIVDSQNVKISIIGN